MSVEDHWDRTGRARQTGQVLALVVAPWCFVAANALDAWNKRSGGDDASARGALALAADHPSAEKAGTLAAMFGCLLLIPAVLAAMRMTRARAARLGLVAGVLVITGYVCYFAMLFQDFATVALAQNGGSTARNVAVQDAITNQPSFVVVALTFVVGNIIGTLLLGWVLVRARSVPRWAGACIMAWPVLHIVGGNWGEVAGAVLQAVGLAVVAASLRQLADTEQPLPAAIRVRG